MTRLKYYLLAPTIIFALCVCVFTPPGSSNGYAAGSLAGRLSGRILLQTESYGRAWYVNPTDGYRYYLKDGTTAFELMRSLGRGISNRDLALIPTGKGQPTKSPLTARVAGSILLQVESKGEAWYVNPVDGYRSYLKDGATAYTVLKQFALGIRTKDLARIPMNPYQLAHDTTFTDVAYAVVENGHILQEKNSNVILPIASLTKLMSALVLLDLHIDFEKIIHITQDHIEYPKHYVGNDMTSEIHLVAGDQIRAMDVWDAMLTASSNQATIALVDASGLSRTDFVAAMNTKASELKLSKTIFFDPTGLDAHTVSTAEDMLALASLAFQNPNIVRGTQRGAFILSPLQNGGKQSTVADRNIRIRSVDLDAFKTGFLVEAENCIALKSGGRVIVILHAHTPSHRYTLMRSLLAYKK